MYSLDTAVLGGNVACVFHRNEFDYSITFWSVKSKVKILIELLGIRFIHKEQTHPR